MTRWIASLALGAAVAAAGCGESTTVPDMDGGNDGGTEETDGGNGDGGETPVPSCLSDTRCVDSTDCPDGYRCNTALERSRCQELFCGEAGSTCSEDGLCQDGLYCNADNRCEEGDGGRQLCIETCEKSNECFDMAQDCPSVCSGGDGDGGSCSNQAEIEDQLRMCNAGPCGVDGQQYTECLSDLPACE